MAYKPKDTQERILHRLKIAKGHLEKVIYMVEQDTYCVEVLHQSQAIQSALQKTDAVILENHLRTCVANAIKKGDDQQSIAEIMELFIKRR